MVAATRWIQADQGRRRLMWDTALADVIALIQRDDTLPRGRHWGLSLVREGRAGPRIAATATAREAELIAEESIV